MRGAIRAAAVVQSVELEPRAEEERAPYGITAAWGFCPCSWDLDASPMVEEEPLVEVAVAQAGEEQQ